MLAWIIHSGVTEEQVSQVAGNGPVSRGGPQTKGMERTARKKSKLIAKHPRSHCSSTLLCPLASRLTPRSRVCRAFSWAN